MKRLVSVSNVALWLIVASICQFALVGAAFGDDPVKITRPGATKWKFQIQPMDSTLKLGTVQISRFGALDGELLPLPDGNIISKDSDSPQILVPIPDEIQKAPQACEFTASFNFVGKMDANRKSQLIRKVRFDEKGFFIQKDATGDPLLGASAARSAGKVISATTDADAKKSAEQLKKWILDRAMNGKVPGIAYFDHEPKTTTEDIARLFANLATEAQKPLVPPKTSEQKVKDLRTQMELGLKEIYLSRPGVKKDWEPFLKDIQIEVGDLHTDTPSSDSGKFDLNNLDHIALIFATISQAFGELNSTHDKVEKFFLGGGSLSGSITGGVTSGGESTNDDSRCRRRHRRTCWSLLLGL